MYFKGFLFSVKVRDFIKKFLVYLPLQPKSNGTSQFAGVNLLQEMSNANSALVHVFKYLVSKSVYVSLHARDYISEGSSEC